MSRGWRGREGLRGQRRRVLNGRLERIGWVDHPHWGRLANVRTSGVGIMGKESGLPEWKMLPMSPTGHHKYQVKEELCLTIK